MLLEDAIPDKGPRPLGEGREGLGVASDDPDSLDLSANASLFGEAAGEEDAGGVELLEPAFVTGAIAGASLPEHPIKETPTRVAYTHRPRSRFMNSDLNPISKREVQ